MAIIPNASPDEKFSPFYKSNETFCKEFEKFIASKNGYVKGKYNAFSYMLVGKINSPTPWDLIYKKSTFSSTGNLWLSSKKQSLFVSVEWKTTSSGFHNSEFKIRKKRLLDSIKIKFNKDLSLLEFDDNYIVESEKSISIIDLEMLMTLKKVFVSGEVFQVICKNEEFCISLRSEKHYFSIINKLLQIHCL